MLPSSMARQLGLLSKLLVTQVTGEGECGSQGPHSLPLLPPDLLPGTLILPTHRDHVVLAMISESELLPTLGTGEWTFPSVTPNVLQEVRGTSREFGAEVAPQRM